MTVSQRAILSLLTLLLLRVAYRGRNLVIGQG